jgi:hypothetical protein
MKKLWVFLIIVCVAFSCDEDDAKPGCGTPAVVRDLSGLDGCGFVFELESGTRLEPLRIMYCFTDPVSTGGFLREAPEDPLTNFEFVDGKRVLIDYEEQSAGSICMVGAVVKITCLTEVSDGNPVAR